MSKTDPAAIDAAKPSVPLSATVPLDCPIVRGEQTIDQLVLRKPCSGELRGIALADLMKLDVAALIMLLPRITSPALTPHDAAQLDLADLAQIGGEVVSFFFTKADRASLFPRRVEDAMADIAAIFHWPPEAMYALSLTELAEWRERARERSGAD